MSCNNFRPDELDIFTGSERWYQHYLVKSITYTEGVRYLAARVEAYWRIDEIVFAQKANKEMLQQRMQIWHLNVKDNEGELTCIGDDETIIFKKKIPYTDFPMKSFKLYFSNNVLLLPSEY